MNHLTPKPTRTTQQDVGLPRWIRFALITYLSIPLVLQAFFFFQNRIVQLLFLSLGGVVLILFTRGTKARLAGRKLARRKKTAVPQTAEFLLLLIPQQDREYLIGDMEEEFTTIVLPRHGRKRACLWYWWHTMFSLFPYVRQFVKRLLGIAVILRLIGR